MRQQSECGGLWRRRVAWRACQEVPLTSAALDGRWLASAWPNGYAYALVPRSKMRTTVMVVLAMVMAVLTVALVGTGGGITIVARSL